MPCNNPTINHLRGIMLIIPKNLLVLVTSIDEQQTDGDLNLAHHIVAASPMGDHLSGHFCLSQVALEPGVCRATLNYALVLG